MATIELVDEQIDAIVVQELQCAYECNMHPNKIDCSDDYIDPDQELLHSIRCVLRYFMVPSKYQQWFEEVHRGNDV